MVCSRFFFHRLKVCSFCFQVLHLACEFLTLLVSSSLNVLIFIAPSQTVHDMTSSWKPKCPNQLSVSVFRLIKRVPDNYKGFVSPCAWSQLDICISHWDVYCVARDGDRKSSHTLFQPGTLPVMSWDSVLVLSQSTPCRWSTYSVVC